MATNDSEHSSAYLAAAGDLARAVDPARLDAMARGLAAVRERGGRLFILGVGGGAGHASHAVNDFRKLCRLESYAPDRQRLRAHGAHQRRRLGDVVQRVARGLAAVRGATRCSCSPSAAARASTTSR